MGNNASCIQRSTRPSTAKLVDAEGNLRSVEIPTGAAELMLEAPGHVVARAEEVVRTRRVSALRADEELRPGEVYLLLPVERVGSRLSDQQMAVVVGAVEGGMRRRRMGQNGCGPGSRVFPEAIGLKEEEEEEELTGIPGPRIGGFRHWRPVLDTIHESN